MEHFSKWDKKTKLTHIQILIADENSNFIQLIKAAPPKCLNVSFIL